MAKHRHRERRRQVPRNANGRVLGPLIRPASPVPHDGLLPGDLSVVAVPPASKFRRFTPEDIRHAEENGKLARRIEDPDSAENRLMRAVYSQLDDYVPDGEEYDPSGVLARLLRSLGDDDESMSSEEVAARVARFRESLARMDSDPAERARIERIAREAGVVPDGE